jgi:apolipoprotein N-acyltransferase
LHTLAGSNVMVAAMVIAWIGRRRPHFPALALAALCPALLVGYGALRLRAVEREMARAPRAKVGVVQAYVGKYVRSAVGTRRSLDLSAALVEKQHLDLLVWPEGGVRTVYRTPELPGTLLATLYGSDTGRALPQILTGVEVQDVDAAGSKLPATNSAVLLDPSAGVLGRYDKNHLVPFGEYVPFGGAFPVLYRWLPNSGQLRRGDAPAPIPFGEHLLAPLICYEDTLPGYADAMMQGGRPDLLVNLTNDIWFGRTAASAQHFALSKLRAVEHHRFLVRAGNTGVSAFVDPTGRVIRQAPPFVAATLTGEIAWMHGTTLYETIGDAPWWLCAAAILAMGAVQAPRGERRGARRRDTYTSGGNWTRK